MDEKQILKEIAYYSRIINQHKKWEQSYQPNKYVKPPMKAEVNRNKYKYVKRNEPSVIMPVQSIAVPSKVLINPNFKTSVHINPHFTIANQQSSTIHVNPKVLNQQLTLNRVQAITKIKLNSVASMCNVVKPVVVPKSPARKRRSSIRSKYKIVKSSVLNTSVKVNKQFIANKYKIDRRSSSILNRSIARKKIVTYGLSDLIRNKVFRNKTWKKTKVVLNHFKVNNNSALTNISGIMYRKSVTKLQKVDKTVQKSSSLYKHNLKQRRCLVNIKGYKYVMDSNKKTLKLVSNNAITNKKHPIVKKILIKGVTFVQKTKNTYVRSNVSGDNLRKFKLHQNKLQAIGCLRKNNIPCPVYRRFGKCRRKESGRCNFLHNPDQIFLCKKFLQGACIDNECLLSHKVSLEKMPTCKYFLEGCCIRSECSYLHVKINPKADICRKFLEGFCEDGNKCNKRHQFLCPHFERDGTCPRRKCMYPHKTKTDNVKSLPVKQATPAVHTRVAPAASEPGSVEPARYYVDPKPSNESSIIATAATEPPAPLNEVTTEVSNIEHNCDLEPDTEVRRRPQLGALPSFIPF